MIIDTTNDELLINGQRWQRGGYLLATAYATDQINITARDGRVIGKAIEWDRILDKDKNTFGLDRDGTVTALTNIFNSQVKSPYKIDALRDVENGTAAYGEIMIYRSPGEWQYEVLEQYHHAYNSEAATLRAGATATTELYYTAQADGDGLSESAQSNTPATGYQIVRKLYYAEAAQADPDTGTWVQFAALAPNTTYASAKATLLAYLKERTGGTVPISLKMTWEEVLAFDFLLDDYSGAAAGYSLRKLRNAYAGSAIRVRRASDNAEQDIGFSANELDTTSLASFCSGTDGFVKTWYDQSGNANDATQTTTGAQPQIVSSGSLITENGKPAVEFDGTDDLLDLTGFTNSASDYTMHAVTKYSSTDSYLFDSLSGRFILDGRGTSRGVYFDGSWRGSSHTGTTQQLQSIYAVAPSSGQSYVNGTQINTGLVYVQTAISGTTSLGAAYTGTPRIAGTIQEFILYASDQSANRTGIESNINTFYSIY